MLAEPAHVALRVREHAGHYLRMRGSTTQSAQDSHLVCVRAHEKRNMLFLPYLQSMSRQPLLDYPPRPLLACQVDRPKWTTLKS